jgi:hypothetical protein
MPVAAAVPLEFGDIWTEFNFGEEGSAFPDPFAFSLFAPARFDITDGYLAGDQFEIFINGESQGLTSPTIDDLTYANSFDEAFISPKFSHQSYYLDPGVYSLSGIVRQSPYGTGTGGVRLVLESNVPEPSAWAMLVIGFGAIGWTFRRRTIHVDRRHLSNG